MDSTCLGNFMFVIEMISKTYFVEYCGILSQSAYQGSYKQAKNYSIKLNSIFIISVLKKRF
jgi:hypothetical protein